MSSLYQKIQEGIKVLPSKDAKLCEKFLENREFDKVTEIVKSCIYMKEKDDLSDVHKDKWVNIDIGDLEQLMSSIIEYTSYLELPEDNESLEEFY